MRPYLLKLKLTSAQMFSEVHLGSTSDCARCSDTVKAPSSSCCLLIISGFPGSVSFGTLFTCDLYAHGCGTCSSRRPKQNALLTEDSGVTLDTLLCNIGGDYLKPAYIYINKFMFSKHVVFHLCYFIHHFFPLQHTVCTRI